MLKDGDVFVIAVNGCQLRNGPFSAIEGISQFPVAAEVCFGFGAIQLVIDKETLEVSRSQNEVRPSLINQNSSKVAAAIFLDRKFEAVSAIWAIDFNGSAAIGGSEPSYLINNPYAKNPLPNRFLPADKEYVATDIGDAFELASI